MDNACKEFLKALKEAERQGKSVDIVEIGKKISRFPPGASVVDVFEKCRERGWVAGSAWGPGLTPQGKKQACSAN
jgi:hypothetical protein